MRLFYLIKKELIEVLRQKEFLFLLFGAPLIQVVVLGYVVTTDIRNIPVEIVNLSHSVKAAEIVTRIESTPLFRVKKVTPRVEDFEAVLKRGEVRAVIIFRDAANRNKSPLKYPEVQILMDGIDANTSQIAAGYFNGIIKQYILSDIRRQGRDMPIVNKTLIRYNPRLRSINYMGPGIVALLLTMLTLFITALSIIREKEQQTMDTLLMSRLRPLEIYVGKAAPAALIGLIDMALGVAVVALWFRIPIRGSLLDLLLVSIIYLAAILSYALLISTLVANQMQAMFFAWFSMVTFMLLGGFLTPLNNLREKAPLLMLLADIDPFRYLIEIIREIFLKGNGITYFWKQLLALMGMAVALTSLSLANFKRLISK
jgi:ABC-2 type transport system permease protein